MTYNAGDKLCNCTLLQKCGYGSYGEVWLTEDAIGTRIALKILRGKYSEREVAGLKRYKDCNHPNLLKIRYVEINDDVICYTMDAADDLNCGKGEYSPDTLANRLNQFGRLDGKEITAMVEGLLDGLEELHSKGLVHRDIKPDNILWVNGRATLADVGLIANDGANSLAGTPGFLSPRVMEGKPAESCDDFYALGKVIYCAMTGLAVKEYPSLPTDMTISMDANLNRVVRESCTNPIHSTAEFRQLLAGKKVVQGIQKTKKTRVIPWPKVFFALLFTFLCGGFFYLFTQQQKMKEKHTVQPVPRDIEAEKRLEELLNAEKAFKKELQDKVLNIFERSGWLNNSNMLAVLTNYPLMTGKEMQNLLFNSNGNPRLSPTGGVAHKTVKISTPLELTLFSMLPSVHYPDFDAAKVHERQRYWRNRGDIKAMLTSDPVMQAIALDAIIRHGINTVLERGEFQGNEQTELAHLIALRHALLDPEWGKLQYISKKFLP